jgi:hypothetical protein
MAYNPTIHFPYSSVLPRKVETKDVPESTIRKLLERLMERELKVKIADENGRLRKGRVY